MYQALFKIRSKARTLNGINKAIERDTGISHFYENPDRLESALICGFLELSKNYITIYGDVG